MNRPLGVILMNLGGPEGPESVKPFLKNLFSDPEILPVPLGRWTRPILAALIARARAPKSRAIYERIGGRSPLLSITRSQALGLEQALGEQGGQRWKVRVAMRYWHPRAEEAIGGLVREGVERAVALPLYPQYSRATAGSSLAEVESVAASTRPALEITAVRSWHDDPGYLDALAGTVREGLARFEAGLRERVHVLFSAHSIPMRLVEAADPYPREVDGTVAGVVRRLGLARDRWRLGYQSRVGPVRWLGPSTPAVIGELAAAGAEGILVVPVSFVADNVETLEEIDMRYRGAAERAGIGQFQRAPALNDSPDLLATLASIARRAASRAWGIS